MRLLIILMFTFSSSYVQAVTVTFSGIFDNFTFFANSPFVIGDSYSGSFEIDQSVNATVSPGFAPEFVGAIDNFSLNIAGSSFSGSNGSLIQSTDFGNAGPGMLIVIGNVSGTNYGTLAGSDPDGNSILSIEIKLSVPVPDELIINPGPLVPNGVSMQIAFQNGTSDLPFISEGIDQFAYEPGMGNQPPNGTINTPKTDLTIIQGQSVNFTGNGTDPDNNLPLAFAWDFGGGAANSTLQSPGNVTFNSQGVFPVMLTVTDSLGLADPTSPTLTITVSTATPPPATDIPTLSEWMLILLSGLLFVFAYYYSR